MGIKNWFETASGKSICTFTYVLSVIIFVILGAVFTMWNFGTLDIFTPERNTFWCQMLAAQWLGSALTWVILYKLVKLHTKREGDG